MFRSKSAFAEFERLHDQMEQMWRRMTEGPAGRNRFCSPILAPPTDVFETADHVVVVAEIAGIQEQEVEIEIEGERLRFHGEKSDREAKPTHRHTQMEICYGAFERTLLLPARIDPEGIRVSYSEGFLRIVLPKLREPGSHRVRVTAREKGN
ncbi:MAG: Hsp20/alpha crystallin family protein [Dehalococcoidia bacterium]|jgi:HSP20 family protein